MKNLRLKVANALFMVALFCPFAFADGDQGSGGLSSPGTSIVKTAGRLPEEGDQGSGGRSTLPTYESYIDTVLRSVSEYIDWLI